VIVIAALTLVLYKDYLRILPEQIACAVLLPVIGMCLGYGESIFSKNCDLLRKRVSWA